MAKTSKPAGTKPSSSQSGSGLKNAPSTTGNKSGTGRGNNPPKGKK